MKRRDLLKLLGVSAVAAALPLELKSKPVPEKADTRLIKLTTFPHSSGKLFEMVHPFRHVDNGKGLHVFSVMGHQNHQVGDLYMDSRRVTYRLDEILYEGLVLNLVMSEIKQQNLDRYKNGSRDVDGYKKKMGF